MSMYTYLAKALSLSFVLLLLAGCANNTMQMQEMLPDPQKNAALESDHVVDLHANEPIGFTVEEIKALKPVSSYDYKQENASGLTLPKGKFVLNADALPLNRFLHLALGDVLKLSFEIDPQIAKRTDPITLHIATPVKADRLLAMVDSALGAYQIGLMQHASGVKVVASTAVNSSLPEVLSGRQRAMLRLGRTMEFVPLRYAEPVEILSFAHLFLNGGKLLTTMNERLNAIVLIGDAESVAKMRKAIRAVDVPSMGGKQLRLIRPVYWQAMDLAAALEKALKMQGVPIAKTSSSEGLYIFPIKQINALLVSSPKAAWLDVLVSMASQLDSSNAAGESEASFIYFVKQTGAKDLGDIINKVLGGAVNLQSKTAGKGSKKTVVKVGVKPVSSGRQRVIIDKQRNALIFVGSARAYKSIYSLLQRLDKPDRQVLIEAMVADVTLDASRQLGVEWQFNNVDNSSALTGTLSTLGGLGVGAGGLSYSLVNAAGSVRAKLNALAASGDAKILSTPRLLTKNHETATINVGTQISVVTSEAADAAGNAVGGTSVLRTFAYIDTGVILTFTPVILDDGRVELKIRQEVSEAGSSTNNSPPIFKRLIETTLVASSGQSIIIGGLITHNKTEQKTMVPWLGDIPLLGNFFSSTSTTDRSTELIVEITPHVISGPDDADYLSAAFKEQLGWAREGVSK